MWVQSLGQEDHLEKEMATHSSILAWKIPWRGARPATVREVAESQTRLSTCNLSSTPTFKLVFLLPELAQRSPVRPRKGSRLSQSRERALVSVKAWDRGFNGAVTSFPGPRDIWLSER